MNTKTNRKWTRADKLEVVRLYEEGYGCNLISRSIGITRGQVIEWLRRYRELGLSGLDKLSGTRVSDNVKAEIVSEIRKKNLSLQAASIQYGKSATALWRWKKEFGSSDSSVSTAVSKTAKPMGRPKKEFQQSEIKRLQTENSELKVELAYLKKVRALVEKKESYAPETVPKPSKN